MQRGGQVKIILKEDIDNLGAIGDIVNVKDGYGRNYLIPRGLAVEATRKDMAQLEHQKRLIQDQRNRRIRSAEKQAEDIEAVSLTIPCKVGEADKLFGSVTAREIAEAMREEGFNIDKSDIMLSEPLKNLGVYTVPVKIPPNITASIKVWLVRK
jgi:large subunit ribosomal protein L9